MAEFQTKPDRITSYAGTISESSRRLRTEISRIEPVTRNLNAVMSAGDGIRNSICNNVEALEQLTAGVLAMGVKLGDIAELYRNTERQICEGGAGMGKDILTSAEKGRGGSGTSMEERQRRIRQEVLEDMKRRNPELALLIELGLIPEYILDAMIKEAMERYYIAEKIDSIVYDRSGSYGGNQAHPDSVFSPFRKKELQKLIEKNTGHKFKGKEFDNYLKRLNNEGCGYVAIANTIMVEFADKPQAFERVFGYPLKHNGDLNYDMLIADIYSRYDNTNEFGQIDPYQDYDPRNGDAVTRDNYSVWNDTTGRGTSPEEQGFFLEQFMKSKGYNVDVNQVGTNVTAVDCANYISQGKQITVAASHVNLYNRDGTVYASNIGGHSMTVTGVTPDGNLLVSSWGKEFMIDPAEGKAPGSYMHFMTVDFK